MAKKRKPKIKVEKFDAYLASPYSHPDSKVRYKRFRQVSKCAAALSNENKFVYCPIAHSVPIAQGGRLPTDFEFWSQWDYKAMSCCEEIWVLKLKGWDKSIGVLAEIKKAKRWGMKVRYLEPSDYGIKE